MKVYSVSQITNYIKSVLDSDAYLGNICIKGEISNFNHHSAGHLYFTLKDDGAVLNAIMFRSSAEVLKFTPENGMKVVVCGSISVYPKNGSYQIYVREMEPSGKGELYLAYEQLKAQLEKQGMFDKAHKKSIPKFPKCVAVITSPTGAAVRDIINVLTRRNNTVEIVLIPTLVQGEFSSEDIVSSLNIAQRWGKADTIILGRGGGSIEDLWSFNTPEVARAIYECSIPIISAVGHETDFTIADFVSDMRAPTPSAAAELAVTELYTIRESLSMYNNRMEKAVNFKLKNAERLKTVADRIKNAYANKCSRDKRLEGLFARLNSAMWHKISINKNRLEGLNMVSSGERLIRLTEQHSVYACSVLSEINKSINHRLDKSVNSLKGLVSALNSNSPTNILTKGYSLVYMDNRLIKSIAEVQRGSDIEVRLSDGCLAARVTDIKSEGMN